MVKTAVVILNWNGLRWLQKFLKTVVDYSSDDDTVIYLSDNGSTDGSANWVSENFSNIKLIRLDKNYGFAGGYNRTLQQIEAKYLILLNSDVEVTPGWHKPLIDHLEKNPDTASCQPKIKSYFQKDHFEYAGAAGGFIDRLGYTFCRGRLFSFIEKDEGQYDDLVEIFWSSGACMAISREAWIRCGGFDEEFFAHMEEIDLCWRFHLAGFRIVYIPGSVVYHAGGGALPYSSELKTYLNFRNNLYLLYKNLPDKSMGRTIFNRKILDGLAVIFFIVTRKFRSARAVWKAHHDYNQGIKTGKVSRNHEYDLDRSERIKTFLNKSIVLEFYFKGNKTFNCLMSKKQS